MLFLISNNVLIYREKGGWKEPYKVITVIDKDVIVIFNVLNNTLIFRNIYVKFYIQLKKSLVPLKKLKMQLPKLIFNFNNYVIVLEENFIITNNLSYVISLYFLAKEKDNLTLTFKLQTNDKIIAPNKSYKALNIKKLNVLFVGGIF